MNSFIRVASVAVIGPLLLAIFCGCASVNQSVSGYPDNLAAQTTEIDKLKKYFDRSDPTFAEYDNSATAEPRKQTIRNDIIWGRIEAIDANYFDFTRHLEANSVYMDTGADIASIVASGAASVVSPAKTKSILSAFSAGILGSKNTINTDVFYQKTMPVLISEMNASREAQLAIIVKGLALDSTKYPLNQAMDDTEKYFLAGSVPAAIAQSTTDSGDKNSKATTEAKSVIEVNYNADVAVRSLRNTIQAWLAKDSANYTALAKWYTKNFPHPTIPEATIWLFSASADDLNRAITDLKIK